MIPFYDSRLIKKEKILKKKVRASICCMRNGTTLKHRLYIKLLDQNKSFVAEHTSLRDVGEEPRILAYTLDSHHFFAVSNYL